MRPAALLLLLLLAGVACQTTRQSPYMRIETKDGRLYYAYEGRALRSESGGFMVFKDLVTREAVRLKNGTYTVEPCSQREVAAWQSAYLDDPTRPPRAQ